jgi:hypothetical protein
VYTDDYQEVWALTDKFLEFDGEQTENEILEYLTENGYNAEIAFDISKSKYSTSDAHPGAEPMFWLKLSLTEENDSKRAQNAL